MIFWEKFTFKKKVSCWTCKYKNDISITYTHVPFSWAERCVAYAYVHALQIKERLEAIIMKQDPSLLEDLNPEKLFDMFEDRRNLMILNGCSTKPRQNIRMVHIGLILKEVGLRGQSSKVTTLLRYLLSRENTNTS
jgi:hypothetical protein